MNGGFFINTMLFSIVHKNDGLVKSPNLLLLIGRRPVHIMLNRILIGKFTFGSSLIFKLTFPGRRRSLIFSLFLTFFQLYNFLCLIES